MSYGRFASVAIATAAGVAGGYYTFKPELDDLQRDRDLKESGDASGIRNIVEKAADSPETGLRAIRSVPESKDKKLEEKP